MRFFKRQQIKDEHINIKKFKAYTSRFNIHNRLYASLTFDQSKIIRTFSLSTNYIARTKKECKLKLKTKNAAVWDGRGGVIFFASNASEINEQEQKQMLERTEARLREIIVTFGRRRAKKRVSKNHESVYNDRTTVRYNVGRYVTKPFILNEALYNETTPALYIKGVDQAELLQIAKNIFSSVAYFDVLLVQDFNSETFYELSEKQVGEKNKKTLKQTKTLVIDPEDPSFATYKELYEKTSHTLITQHDIAPQKLVTLIKDHDHIIIIGRGKGNMLINPRYAKNSDDLKRYIISRQMLVYLKDKKVTRMRKPFKTKD